MPADGPSEDRKPKSKVDLVTALGVLVTIYLLVLWALELMRQYREGFSA